MSLMSLFRRGASQGAAEVDSPPNIAVRVLSIVARFRTFGEEEYGNIFGPLMLKKAKALEAVLEPYPDLIASGEGDQWTIDWKALVDTPELTGKLAAVVQMPSPFEQVLTEELDEIVAERAMTKEMRV